MTPRLKKQLVNYLFKLIVVEIWGYDFYSFVHDDFLNVSLNAMYTLKSAGKSNLLHSLSQCFYRANQDSQPRMALNKMPFGLIDYNIRFFASNLVQSVHAKKHYTSWVETMFSHFGHRWLCLFRGPAWQYEIHDSNEQTNGKTEHNTVSEERCVPVAPTHISEVATSKDILECAMYESGIHDERFDESNVDINSLVLLDTCENPEFENSKDYSLMPDEVGGDKSSVQRWSTHSELKKNVSTFWTHLTLSEVAERVDSGYSPGLMEQHHRITAMACHPRKRITSYDPMKVCMVTYSQ